MYQKIAVLGATGNIGTRLTHALLAQGAAVTAIAHPSARLDALAQAGATARAGSVTDAAFLTEALAGADAAFLMTPSNWTAPDVLAFTRQVGESIAQAVRASGLPAALNLSSLGAELGDGPTAGSGPIRGLRAQEDRLNALPGLRVLHLRPAYFLENLLADIPLIQHRGLMGSPVRADLSFPLIATRDIAAKAAALLQRGIAATGVQELVGPRNYTLAEAAAAVGTAIGRPALPYVQVPAEQAKQGMLQHGISESMADLFQEMLAGMNAERLLVQVRRDPENTTPTTLETFAQEVFAPAYQAASVQV